MRLISRVGEGNSGCLQAPALGNDPYVRCLSTLCLEIQTQHTYNILSTLAGECCLFLSHFQTEFSDEKMCGYLVFGQITILFISDLYPFLSEIDVVI